jgi:hypothetical protein
VKFAHVPEPEFPGHVLLEQYQAQVGAALRPAFTPETAPDVTAAACEVCSRWIGSGVARDLNDLRRVHQLLVSSLTKLKDSRDTSPLYSESASTMEKLSVLKAWAEVYIVTMEEEKDRQKQRQHSKDATAMGATATAGTKLGSGATTPGDDDDSDSQDFGDFLATDNESLLSLVQPEMKTLSQHWLAALKDYALLSLPSEYSSQLPPEGGAFYTPDTMDASRPHYRRSWSPILYAVSLWLHETGFTSVDKDDSRPANMKVDDRDVNRFHLLIGICIEALCNPTSVQPVETVNLCLKALSTLLDDPWTRMRLGSDDTLAIELLNVLHRLLLTRDSIDCFVLIMGVVRQVVKAAQDHIDSERALSKENVDKSSNVTGDGNATATRMSTSIGDGSESGEIVPGKSLVFATLEVCLCILVRHLPTLNPALPASSALAAASATAAKQATFSETTSQLLAGALQTMSELPSLCSPAGSVSVLPTVLFLTTGVLRELGPKGSTKVSVIISSALQCLKTLCSSPLSRDITCSAGWTRHLQSALATIIEYSQPDVEKGRAGLEDTTLLLAVAIFFVSCSPDVVLPLNLLTPCVQIFARSWESSQLQVRLKCIQSLISICQHADRSVSTSLIHAVATPVLLWILNCANEHDRPTDEMEFAIIVEGMKLAEVLVSLTDEHSRIHLVAIVVPMLVSFLSDSDPVTNDAVLSTAVTPLLRRRLHEVALKKLIEFGTQYQSEFRSVMQSQLDLRSRLEQAIVGQQQQQHRVATAMASRSAAAAESRASQSSKATIKLKMDFSNFAS